MNNDISGSISNAVAEALALDAEEVTPDATILDELGAESIDLLDILFRVERDTGVKVSVSDLAEYVQGGIPDEEFGDEALDEVSPKGMSQLEKVMPQLKEMTFEKPMSPTRVMKYFTVQNLTDMVAARSS